MADEEQSSSFSKRRSPRRDTDDNGSDSRPPRRSSNRSFSGRQRSNYGQRRRKKPPVKLADINWKNLRALRYFLEDDGSLRPRRKTGASAKYQRQVALAVKRARYMALLPYTHGHLKEMGQYLERDMPDLRRTPKS
ncbi:MAG TPA: 30S ribosomal protein S18 [Anaerolineae bacterium]|nr:30S ribosomal protein S18 [Anaerolineae bacterium]MCB9107567.1 30S ribosomal protein S18 [Anaerolineales bacterium]HRV91639.1 30S ribosomal protein S18 [Anaerolineae bacterium]